MAIEYWTQIESRPWDLSLNDIDRMTGRTMKEAKGFDKVMETLTSVVPEMMPPRAVLMNNPLRDGATVIDAGPGRDHRDLELERVS